jgi:hypothetical protein
MTPDRKAPLGRILRLIGGVLLAGLAGCTWVVQGTSQPVTFTSDPPGAMFTVGGQTLTTPATVTLPKEEREIVLKRQGYEDATVSLKRKISLYFIGSVVMGVIASSIDIISGAWREFETTDVHVSLTPRDDQPVDLPLTVRTDPPGAEIAVDEVSYGKAPREIILTWNPADREKKVTARLAGFRDRTVPLRRGEKELDIPLEGLPRTLSVQFVTKPEGAEIRVEGRSLGRTPLTAEVVWGPKDPPRSVAVALKGYREAKRELKPTDALVDVALEEIVEEIPFPVRVTPAGAAVAIDGTARGEAPLNVPLSWSISKNRHTVVISNPGYSTRTVVVTRESAEKGLDVRLAPSVPGDR